MAVTRRTFVAAALRVLALSVAGVRRAAAGLAPVRIVQAVRARRYAGAVRPPDPDAVGRTGHWRG
ncbi:MAG: hypothetical protein JXR37_17335 [Kiritimatiellae bacterium]|nr:hypothetical protein [Kiritimatiellia bacterium]